MCYIDKIKKTIKIETTEHKHPGKIYEQGNKSYFIPSDIWSHRGTPDLQKLSQKDIVTT